MGVGDVRGIREAIRWEFLKMGAMREGNARGELRTMHVSNRCGREIQSESEFPHRADPSRSIQHKVGRAMVCIGNKSRRAVRRGRASTEHRVPRAMPQVRGSLRGPSGQRNRIFPINRLGKERKAAQASVTYARQVKRECDQEGSGSAGDRCCRSDDNRSTASWEQGRRVNKRDGIERYYRYKYRSPVEGGGSSLLNGPYRVHCRACPALQPPPLYHIWHTVPAVNVIMHPVLRYELYRVHCRACSALQPPPLYHTWNVGFAVNDILHLALLHGLYRVHCRACSALQPALHYHIWSIVTAVNDIPHHALLYNSYRTHCRVSPSLQPPLQHHIWDIGFTVNDSPHPALLYRPYRIQCRTCPSLLPPPHYLIGNRGTAVNDALHPALLYGSHRAHYRARPNLQPPQHYHIWNTVTPANDILRPALLYRSYRVHCRICTALQPPLHYHIWSIITAVNTILHPAPDSHSLTIIKTVRGDRKHTENILTGKKPDPNRVRNIKVLNRIEWGKDEKSKIICRRIHKGWRELDKKP